MLYHKKIMLPAALLTLPNLCKKLSNKVNKKIFEIIYSVMSVCYSSVSKKK